MTFFSNDVFAKELIHNLKHPCLSHSFLCRDAMTSLELSLYSVCRALCCHKIWKWLTLLTLELACCVTMVNILSLFCSFFWRCYCVNVLAVPSVDAELAADSVEDIIQHEDRIVSQWREVSANEQHELREKVDEILRPLGFETRLLVIRRANGIALYFFCMTLLAVTSLRYLWRTGQLRDIVCSLFAFLSGTRVYVKKLTWPVTDYERCLQFFSSLQGKTMM